MQERELQTLNQKDALNLLNQHQQDTGNKIPNGVDKSVIKDDVKNAQFVQSVLAETLGVPPKKELVSPVYGALQQKQRIVHWK